MSPEGRVMGVATWVLVFGIGAAALTLAGVVLARSGDEIAVRTGVGGLAVGAVLVALATSLPEVLTSVSAAVADAPDVAVGDLLGSSMANMAILAVIDLFHRGRVWPSVELGHARIASIAIGLTALVALGLLAHDGGEIGWIGWESLLVAGGYVAALAWVRRSPGSHARAGVLPRPTGWGDTGRHQVVTAGEPPEPERTPPRLGAALLAFAGAAAVVALAAPVVAVSGREIASETGLEQTFVGVVLVAISTSLPELVASIAAVRIGAYDLAVGNLFGSNAVNMALLVFVDAAYTDGPILAAVSASQAVAAVGAIVLMSLALAAIVHGEETRIWRLEPDAVLLLVAYVALLVLVAVQG